MVRKYTKVEIPENLNMKMLSDLKCEIEEIMSGLCLDMDMTFHGGEYCDMAVKNSRHRSKLLTDKMRVWRILSKIVLKKNRCKNG